MGLGTKSLEIGPYLADYGQGPENRRQRFLISFAEAIFEAYFSLDKIRFFFVEQNVQRKKKPLCNKMIDLNI